MAPFGLAAGLVGMTNLMHNLGRLHQGRPPVAVLTGDESYRATLRFVLVPESAHRWVLDVLTLDYEMRNRTRLTEGEGGFRDRMDASGWVAWEEGRWHGPAGWKPDVEPRIVLELFQAPTAAECDDPAYRSRWRRLRARSTDTSGWADCYALEILVPHPVRETGESIASSPEFATLRFEARDGAFTISGETVLTDLLRAASSTLKGEPGVPPEFFELVDATLERMDWMAEGIPMGLLATDFTWDLDFQGPRTAGLVAHDDVYRVLTGALVRERLRVGTAEFTLEKAPRTWRPVAEPESIWKPTVETREAVTEAVLVVRARDYGAWGRLKAEIELDDGRWEPARVAASGEWSITIPRDEAGGSNQIADVWEEAVALAEPGKDPKADDETEPGGEHRGDGLTLYEEYRGFSVDGRWTDLDPQRKDLFVHVQDGSGLRRHLDRVARETGLRIRSIRQEEFVNPGVRVVNPNRGLHTRVAQHGLYVSEWFQSEECRKPPEERDPAKVDPEFGCGTDGRAVGGPGTPQQRQHRPSPPSS